MSDVVVRLTEAQLGAVRSIVAITVECGDGSVALDRALRALDKPMPVLTRAEEHAFIDALVAWDGDNMDRDGVLRIRQALDRLQYKVTDALGGMRE